MSPVADNPSNGPTISNGFGASDHFPVSAEFRISGPKTKQGKNDSFIEKQSRQVDYQKASSLARSWNSKSLSPENYGSVFRVKGRITETRPLTLEVGDIGWACIVSKGGSKRVIFHEARIPSFDYWPPVSLQREWQLIVEDRNWIN